MRKLLRSSLVAALAIIASAAHADIYTHTFAKTDNVTKDSTYTLSGISWTTASTPNTANIAYNFDTSNYKKGLQLGTASKSNKEFTISTSGFTETINSVVVNAATASGAKATITVLVGGKEIGTDSLAMSTADYTFKPAAKGDLVIKLTQAETKKALYIASITVNYGAGVSVAAPTISGVTPFATTTTVTIKAAEGNIFYTTDGTEPTANSTAYTEPFQLAQTATVKAIAVNNGTASSTTEKTFEAITTVASDIDDFKSMETGTVALLTLNGAEVIYADASNRNVYVRDDTGGTCFYNLGLKLTTGDVLTGKVAGKVALYNALPEVTKVDATSAADLTIKSGNTFEPKAVALNQAKSSKYICDLVTISGVKLDSVGKNLYASVGTDTLQVYDQMKTLSDLQVATGTEGNSVTGILVVYKTTYEIYPTTAEGIATTSVRAIEMDADNRNTQTYNLAGQRVGADYKGIIVRKGKKMVQK